MLHHHTRKSPITQNAYLHPITPPDTNTLLSDSEKSQQVYFLARAERVCQKESRSKDMFLLSLLSCRNLALLYHPSAERDGNTQRFPAITESKIKSNQTNMINKKKWTKVSKSSRWKLLAKAASSYSTDLFPMCPESSICSLFWHRIFLQPFAPVTIALDKTQYWQSENGIQASHAETVSQTLDLCSALPD